VKFDKEFKKSHEHFENPQRNFMVFLERSLEKGGRTYKTILSSPQNLRNFPLAVDREIKKIKVGKWDDG
jgi:hypothetical protein